MTRLGAWAVLCLAAGCFGGGGGGIDQCVPTTTCLDGSELVSCADAGGQCWYEIEGAVYDCDADCDCAAAAEEATQDCLGAG